MANAQIKIKMEKEKQEKLSKSIHNIFKEEFGELENEKIIISKTRYWLLILIEFTLGLLTGWSIWGL